MFHQEEKSLNSNFPIKAKTGEDFDLKDLRFRDLLPLWSGFAPILSRELPFAIAKFLTFDLIASTVLSFLNARTSDGSFPIQVGVGPIGLAVSAGAGSFAGIGAFVTLLD